MDSPGGSYSAPDRLEPAVFPAALAPLLEIVEALSPRARLTVLSVRDDELEIVASSGTGATPAGTTLRSPLMSAFRLKLSDEGSFVLDIEDAGVPAEVRDPLRRFDLRRALVAPLRFFDDVTECVVVDEPGERMDFEGRSGRLLGAAMTQARASLDNADLRMLAAKRQRVLAAIARLGVVFTSVLDLRETAEQVVDYASLLLELPAFVFLLRPEGAPHFEVLAVEGLPKEALDFTMTPIEVAGLDVDRPGELGAGRLPPGDPGSLLEFLERLGLTDMVVAPLVVADGRLRGMLIGLHTQPPDLGEAEREAFDLLAMQATGAIWNAERFEAEVEAQLHGQQELETTRLLLEAVTTLGASTGLNSLLQALGDVAARSTPETSVVVYLLDEERDRLRVASSSLACRFPDQSFEVGDLPEGMRQALDTRRSLLVDCDFTGPEPRFAAPVPAGIPPHLSLLVPIFRGERALGLLAVDDAGGRQRFTERERQLLESIASQAAVGIENARLYETARRHAELTSVLAEAASSLASSLEIETVLPEVVAAAARALGAPVGGLVRKEAGGWRTTAVYGVTLEAVGEFHTDAQSPILMGVYRTGEPFLAPGLGVPVVLDRSLPLGPGYRSHFSWPVLHRGEVIAVVAFFYEEPRGPLSEEERAFLAQLAFNIGVADENARLYGTQFRIAETLQEALLAMPETVPGIDFAYSYRSATASERIGGDFYDIFELDDDLLGITIGDVAGKGLKAAVLTSLVKNTIRAHAMETDKPPYRVLELTNMVVQKATATEAFATVFFGILDRRDGRLLFSSAGHTTAALVGPRGTAARLPATGPLLGAFPNVEFGQSEARLGPDEVLFLYTDGLTEARRDAEMYGEDRLFDFLASAKSRAVQDIVEAAAGDVLAFSRGHLRDDVAILAVARVVGGLPTPPTQE